MPGSNLVLEQMLAANPFQTGERLRLGSHTLFTIVFDAQSLQRSGLGRFEARMRRADALLSAIAHYLQATSDRAYANESTPEGEKWAKLAASTLRRKARAGKAGAPILVFSGEGRRSTKARVKGNGAELHYIDYMDYHRTGTKTMPARSPVLRPETARAGAVAIAKAYANPRVGGTVVNGVSLSFGG